VGVKTAGIRWTTATTATQQLAVLDSLWVSPRKAADARVERLDRWAADPCAGLAGLHGREQSAVAVLVAPASARRGHTAGGAALRVAAGAGVTPSVARAAEPSIHLRALGHADSILVGAARLSEVVDEAGIGTTPCRHEGANRLTD
jgi:hypothetical protein